MFKMFRTLSLRLGSTELVLIWLEVIDFRGGQVLGHGSQQLLISYHLRERYDVIVVHF